MLNDLYLLFLSIKDSTDEALKRRLAIDKNASKMRRLFSSVGFKNPNLQWLHDQLTQILPWYLLAPYLDILGSLRSKIPELMNYSLEPLLSKGDTKVARALAVVSRKPWDPINSSSLNILKQKLSHATQPIIFTVPTRSVLPRPAPQMKRMRFWNTQLSSFGKIQTVKYNNLPSDIELGENVEKMITNTRMEVVDMHKRNPNKPIILVGWDNAAIISLMVSIMEPECVTAVCCLGFPLISLEGYRGENIDPLLDIKCPVFIAVGSAAANTDIDELEEMRDQFKCKSKMLVVEGGDSLLRVPTDIQLKNKKTQSMIDKHVIDEMWEFLYTVVSSNHSKYTSQRITDLVPLGSRDVVPFGYDADSPKPITKKTSRKPKPAQNIQEYTAFLKEKIKSLGRMPSTEENKKFFEEFKRTRGIKGTKRKTTASSRENESGQATPKRVKTLDIGYHDTEWDGPKTARNEELESATQNLEKLLDE